MKTITMVCKVSYGPYDRTVGDNQAQKNQAQNKDTYDTYDTYGGLHTIKEGGD